jgi:hypothetical protein
MNEKCYYCKEKLYTSTIFNNNVCKKCSENPIGEKKCFGCKEILPLKKYYKNFHLSKGFVNTCKECVLKKKLQESNNLDDCNKNI